MIQEKWIHAKKGEDKARKDLMRWKEKQKKGEKQEETKHEEPDVRALESEVERLSNLLKTQAVSHGNMMEGLEKKIKVLHAQNLALREVSTKKEKENQEKDREIGSKESHDKVVQGLEGRLKDTQKVLATKEKEAKDLHTRIERLEQQLQTRSMPNKIQQSSDNGLERQNAFLKETLLLKRKEWEELYESTVSNYETQLQRMSSRLARYTRGIPEDEDELLHEERAFLASQEVGEELITLREELQDKERTLMEKDRTLMSLELEIESLRVEQERLTRAVSPLKSPAPRKIVRRGSERTIELEQVIEQMKKVIEKLRRENDRLRQTEGQGPKVDLLRKKLRTAREMQAELEQHVERLEKENQGLKQDKLRLQQRVRMIGPSKEKDLEHVLQEKETQIDTLEREKEHFQHQLSALERERDHLQHELSAFDADFFEEIEDLKYKYAQAIREKQRLERKVLTSSVASSS